MKTKLEQLGEQIMHEIQENKKWNQNSVTNEMLNYKLDAIFDRIAITEDKLGARIDKLDPRIGIIEDILRDHTERLRRLEARP